MKAVGIASDRPVAESVLTTAGKRHKLRLTADRTVIHADGEDLSFVTVEAVDAEGRLEPQADQEVQFAISGPALSRLSETGTGRMPLRIRATGVNCIRGARLSWSVRQSKAGL